MANISSEIKIYQILKLRIMEAFNLEDDDQALLDTLEGQTPLNDIILQLVRDAKRTEAFAKGLEAIIKDNHARKERLEARAEKLRGMALWAMGEAGLTKLEKADLTITRRLGAQHIVITDDTAVPDNLCRFTREPNKTAIRKALEDGDAVPGVEWSNAQPVLTVRTK